MTANFDMIQKVYDQLRNKVESAKNIVGRPLTYAEKILYAHLWESPAVELKRGKDFADFKLDRVAMQDATAQMALLQFMHEVKILQILYSIELRCKMQQHKWPYYSLCTLEEKLRLYQQRLMQTI